jgi:DNA-directed RNA polymerase specialized sigma24 family protein
MLKAHMGRRRGHDATSALFVLTHQAVVKWRRRHHRQRMTELPLCEERMGQSAATVETAMAVAQRVALVRSAAAEIPGPFRRVFELVELDGEAGPDVAATLGLSVNTVYTRLFAARRHFSRALRRRRTA